MNPPSSVLRYVALIATLSPAATMSWISAVMSGDAAKKMRYESIAPFLVGRGSWKHLMFDEVIGKPVGRVLEILAAENFLGKAATNCMFSSGVGMQPPRVRRRPPRAPSLMVSLPGVIRPR